MIKINKEKEKIYILYEPSVNIHRGRNENKIWKEIETELEGKDISYGIIKIEKNEKQKGETQEIIKTHIKTKGLDSTTIDIMGGVVAKDNWWNERKPMYKDMKRIVSEILNYNNPIHNEEYHIGAIIITNSQDKSI